MSALARRPRLFAIFLLATLGPVGSAAAQLTALGAQVLDRCHAPGGCLQFEGFSRGLATGDFDDDGFVDLAVGSPGRTIGGDQNAGSVHIFYGSPAGLTEAGEQIFDQDDAEIAGAAEAGDLFGYFLAAGDFDRDGFDDLAISIDGEDLGTTSNTGAIVVLFGSSVGLVADGSLFYSQNNLPPGSAESAEAFDGFGSGLAASAEGGLAIGVPGESFFLPTEARAGLVQILGRSEPGRPFDLVADRSQNDFLDECGLLDGNEFQEFWGSILAFGRFGSTVSSLVVGGVSEDFSGVSNAGRVTVMFGSTLGCFDQNSPGVQDVAEPDDLFGAALGVGDFDDDGFEDLAIGVRGEDLEATGDIDAGVVQILYGSSSGLTTTGNQLWNQDHFSPNEASEDGDEFSSALAGGDFDGDGFDDLAIGVPLENVSGADDVGKVNILYGDVQGLQLAGRQTFGSDFPASMPETAESGDHFGASLATGDFDGNGTDDLAIGMPGEGIGTQASAGAVTVLYGLDHATGAFGTVRHADNAVSFSESASFGLFVVSRTGGAVVAATVNHSRTGGTATPGVDFSYGGGTESWGVGDLSPESFTINFHQDTLDEPNETIIVTLSNPSAGTALGSPAVLTVTLIDDDVAGSLSFAQPVSTFFEPNGTVQVPVVRSNGAASAVTVQFATANGTAIAGADYVATSGTLTWAAGETTRLIPVAVIDDGDIESGEIFSIILSNPGGGGTLGTFTTHQVVILDDLFTDRFETGDTSRWDLTNP